MKKRVLITGASGFVGYHLIEEALNNNLEVYAGVRKNSNIEHLKHLDIQYVHLPYNNLIELKKELKDKQYDYIIHAAGATKAQSAHEYNHINATFTYNLAAAAMASGTNLKGFVLISSLAAVGPLDTLHCSITPNTPPHPLTPYGKSKLLAEEKLSSISSLNYTILRPTAIYGPRDKDIFIFFKQLKKGIEPYIGNIAQKMSFIYVKDLAAISVKALFNCNQQTYNLSDGNFYDRYELANIAKIVLDLKTVKFHLPVNFIKTVAWLSEKVGSLANKATVLNTQKVKELTGINWSCEIEGAKNDLGYYPLYNLDAGLTETLNWYKKNNWL